MLDIKQIRENPDLIKENLKKRQNPNYLKLLDEVIALDKEWREKNVKREELRSRRNKVSKDIATKKKTGESADELMQEAKEIPVMIQNLENESFDLKKDLNKKLKRLPNLLHNSVPYGEDEEGNVVEKEIGLKTEKKEISHPDLLLNLNMANFEQASEVAGSRAYYLLGDISRLDLALQMFTLDIISKKDYSAVMPPLLLRREPYEGVTDLADFEDVLYKIEDEDLFLIATSEHPLAALYMNKVIEEKELPIKLGGVSPCFRKEAGSHGKDTKGIFRVHHFNKIEQFVFCKAEDSWKYHEEMLTNAEEIFKKLKLPYRIVNVCTGDIGTVAAKKYDLEVWMPVQEKYREAVSCSNCTDYQSRRLNIKWTNGSKKEFVHTLNSTAIATSRAMVAILENFQNEDGSVDIPEVLWPYMNGCKKLVHRTKN